MIYQPAFKYWRGARYCCIGVTGCDAYTPCATMKDYSPHSGFWASREQYYRCGCPSNASCTSSDRNRSRCLPCAWSGFIRAVCSASTSTLKVPSSQSQKRLDFQLSASALRRSLHCRKSAHIGWTRMNGHGAYASFMVLRRTMYYKSVQSPLMGRSFVAGDSKKQDVGSKGTSERQATGNQSCL
jgi:hypothetical protein